MTERNTLPNIIFFFTDQQRWDTVGAYGQPLDVTPNLDTLAAEGVRFKHAFTCQPVCGPARSCLQTGKYATETACYRNDISLPQDQKTIAHWLSEAGYEVGYIGKWHLASNKWMGPEEDYQSRAVPLERRGGYKDFWLAADLPEFTSHGYDGHLFNAEMETVEFKGYRVDRQTDFALDYLRARRRGRPFFLLLSYLEPHHQNDHNRYEGPHGSKERFRDFHVPGDLAGTEGDWRQNYPDYLGCVNSLDYNLGRIRRELDALGIAGETLIIFTSDHGCHFRTRNGEYKRACHEACVRVPMIACGPGFRGGQVFDELVSLIDLPPTLLQVAGLEPPPYMRGRPLQDLARAAAVDWRDDVFIQISESHVGRALRTRRWKYSVRAPDKNGWADMDSRRYVEDFLYDLEADPHERNNLVRDRAHKSVRAELRGRLRQRIADVEGIEARIAPAKRGRR
ncbi:MAG: sulfatase-like hydrolase/transferase [Planctomycetes bacterium]|nr:sulfatase-like hydrolase/transferase [Planctomycetota bacterium]